MIIYTRKGAERWKHENNNKNGGKRLWLQRGSSSNTQQTGPCWIAPKSYQNNMTSTINIMCCFSPCSAMSVPIRLSLFKLHVHNQSNVQHLTWSNVRDPQRLLNLLACYRPNINRHAHGPAEGLFRKKFHTHVIINFMWTQGFVCGSP